MRRILLLFLVLTCVQGCDSNRIYERNYDLTDKMWASDNVMRFEFEVETSKEPVNLYFNVRNSLSYPFQNLYVKYTLKDTLDQVFSEELINYNLFDIKTGKPFGSGIGDVFDHRIELLGNYKFKNPGKYLVDLQHYMRPDTLNEIVSIGLRLELVSNE
ncbi:MAG: gliding motility lipoprotein GldH [Bacteroidota bacterium]